MAFIPLVPERLCGMSMVSEGSYKTTFGNTLRSRPVCLTAPAVIPQIGVISDPAYVVGTATIGNPDSSATALSCPGSCLLSDFKRHMHHAAETHVCNATAKPLHQIVDQRLA